jgi:putative DNA primase/helicase
MTQTLIETQRARIQVLEKRIQELESTSVIPALENEIKWLEGVIYNPSYNETDIRLLVGNTPRELRMGLTTVLPEQTTYLPAQAKKAHTSEKTASKRLRKLADTGMFSYRTAVDPENGHTRVHLAPLTQLETAPITHIERAKEGGSTWEEGKRVKRCKDKDCNSSNLVKVTTSEIICAECGLSQGDPIKVRKQVNSPDDLLEEKAHSHSDTELSEEEAHSHSDTDASMDENPKLPSNVYTQGGNGVVETVLPPAELLAPPPAFLRHKEIWCCWCYETDEKGKPTKVPYVAQRGKLSQKAETDNPKTWRTYDQAQALYEQSLREGWKRPFEGVGFMCDGSFIGIDLDHCRNKETGEIAAWAQDIIDRFHSYWYITPSLEGVRIIIHAKKPGPRCKKGDKEIYEEKRFFTWTPMQLPGTPEMIADRRDELTAFYAETFPEQDASKDERQPARVFTPSCPCSDDEVLSKARTAANGPKFRRIYDECNITGYASQSEAELALCRMLAYYSDGDEDAIDRLMRQWNLFRPGKWDRAARSGETYGQGTIRVALGESIAS